MDDIEVQLGDITHQRVEAIVTAVNEPLIDEVVHRAAGPRLAAALAEAGPCAPGEAIATPAFDLWPVKHVIHTVGPGEHGDDLVLTDCYINSLVLAADELEPASIAFPVIAGGVEIAAVAVRSLAIVDLIRFVVSDQETCDALTAELAKPVVERCPTCGADAIPYLIGRPGVALETAAFAGLVRLGGCFSQGEDLDPQWACTKDDTHYWTNGQKDVRRHQVALLAAEDQVADMEPVSPGSWFMGHRP